MRIIFVYMIVYVGIYNHKGENFAYFITTLTFLSFQQYLDYLDCWEPFTSGTVHPLKWPLGKAMINPKLSGAKAIWCFYTGKVP